MTDERTEREPDYSDPRSTYMNARTCVCGLDARMHVSHERDCVGFDPDWDHVRRYFATPPAPAEHDPESPVIRQQGHPTEGTPEGEQAATAADGGSPSSGSPPAPAGEEWSEGAVPRKWLRDTLRRLDEEWESYGDEDADLAEGMKTACDRIRYAVEFDDAPQDATSEDPREDGEGS